MPEISVAIKTDYIVMRNTGTAPTLKFYHYSNHVKIQVCLLKYRYLTGLGQQ